MMKVTMMAPMVVVSILCIIIILAVFFIENLSKFIDKKHFLYKYVDGTPSIHPMPDQYGNIAHSHDEYGDDSWWKSLM